jgi:hypothetical protein
MWPPASHTQEKCKSNYYYKTNRIASWTNNEINHLIYLTIIKEACKNMNVEELRKLIKIIMNINKDLFFLKRKTLQI